jgi:ABC-2 type transport system permease protein
MRNLWVIAEREYKHFFISPIAYLVALTILLFLGIRFYIIIQYASLQQYAPTVPDVVGPLFMLLIFTVPAISMRLLAEEARNGTLELLLTAPVRDWEVVVGKWLGGFLFLLTIIVITWFFPAILNQLIDPGIDQGLMLTFYLGITLVAAAFIAIGVMASSFFSNQIAALFATMGLLFVLLLIGDSSQVMGAAGANSLLAYLDIDSHFYGSFMAGVIELKDVVYYLSVTALSLFIGSAVVEMRRWR